MTNTTLIAQIADLRATNTQRLLESIAVSVVGFLTSVIMPEYMYRTFFDATTISEAQMKFLQEFSSYVFFVIALVFIWTLVTNFLRSRKIAALSQQLHTNVSASTATDSPLSEEELAELESMVDKVLAESEADEPKARVATQRAATAKKTTKRGRPAKK
jgi:uncharacterized membrane protein YcgQ (UPF0703/DUF1980 family)